MAKFAIYQVFTRLFGNPIQEPKLDGSIQENGSGKFNHFTTEVLSKIRDLGITHIWYTGVIRHATSTVYPYIPVNDPSLVKGKAGSPYAITDYYDVDPDLAEDAENRLHEFDQLVDRNHKSGLKLIIDFVPNHLSREYKSIKKPQNTADFGENDLTNTAFHPQNNFYYIPGQSLHLDFPSKYTEQPAKVSGNDIFHAYPTQNDWYETIKLNYGIDVQNDHSKHFSPIPKTWLMMRDILLYWTSKKVDGFRCDMAEMVPVEFWTWVIPKIKEKNPEILFIAEIYNTELYSSYLDQGGFDYLYDKSGLYDSLRAIIEGHKSADNLTEQWQRLNGMDQKMLRFLENHDEQRIASKHFAQYPPRALPAFFIIACMHQNPFMIYFGQEFGEEAKGESGFSGQDGKTSIFDYWNVPSIQNWLCKAKLKPENLPIENYLLYSKYQEIIKFSMDTKAIREGLFYDLMWLNRENKNFDSNSIYAFMRCKGKENYLCLVNFSKDKKSVLVKLNEDTFNFCNIKSPQLFNFKFIDFFSKNSFKISGRACLQEGIPMEILPFGYAAYQF